MWEPSQKQLFDPRRKSPLLAAMLAVIPGVGQLYIGYYMRGIATAAAFVLAVMMGALVGQALIELSVMSAIFIWVFNLIDAGRMAALYNHAAVGSGVVEMPEDFKLPAIGGSILGGVALLLFGGIALSNTAFDYSLQWLEDWWPAFPLALGLYLLVRGVMDVIAARSPRG
jgi:TM2 domain-containing membrane protein YozV